MLRRDVLALGRTVRANAMALFAHGYVVCCLFCELRDRRRDSMETFDDSIPERAFDNFQFVNFTALSRRYPDPHERAMAFALEALMELPEQYQIIKRDGLLRSSPKGGVRFAYRMTGKHRFKASFRPDMVAAASASPSAPEGYAPGGAHPPPYAPHH